MTSNVALDHNFDEWIASLIVAVWGSISRTCMSLLIILDLYMWCEVFAAHAGCFLLALRIQ